MCMSIAGIKSSLSPLQYNPLVPSFSNREPKTATKAGQGPGNEANTKLFTGTRSSTMGYTVAYSDQKYML